MPRRSADSKREASLPRSTESQIPPSASAGRPPPAGLHYKALCPGPERVANPLPPCRTDPLRVTLTPKKLKTGIGSTVILSCTLVGSPEYAIRWYRNTDLVVVDDYISIRGISNETLLITAAQKSHSGAYQCFATRKAQTAQDFSVIVLEGESAPGSGEGKGRLGGPRASAWVVPRLAGSSQACPSAKPASPWARPAWLGAQHPFSLGAVAGQGTAKEPGALCMLAHGLITCAVRLAPEPRGSPCPRQPTASVARPPPPCRPNAPLAGCLS